MAHAAVSLRPAIASTKLVSRVSLGAPSTSRPTAPLTVVEGAAAPARRSSDRFTEELIRIRPELYARAMRLARDPARADDLVQDATERALRFRGQFTEGTSLRAWVQTIVFSVFVTDYRRRRRDVKATRALTVDPCAWTHNDVHSPEACGRALTPRLQHAVDQLGKPFREVLVLVDLDELSYKDAANTLGVPVGTVMSRLHRARKQLGAMVESFEPLAA